MEFLGVFHFFRFRSFDIFIIRYPIGFVNGFTGSIWVILEAPVFCLPKGKGVTLKLKKGPD